MWDILYHLCCCSAAKSCLTWWSHELQHTRLPCPSLSPGVGSNSCPSSRWCHSTILSFVSPFSSCPQSFPASGSFPVSQLLASGSQSIGASASVSVLPINIQDWFPLELTGLISLLLKGKHEFTEAFVLLSSLQTTWGTTVELGERQPLPLRSWKY